MLFQLLIIVTSGCLFCVNAKICPEIHVHNHPSFLEEQLRGCTIVAGDLKLLLIENQAHEDFEALSFPELTEIRGYLMVYRIYKLRTLAKLFPNLTIIRGLNLFRGYSFVLHDLPDLTVIDLPNLKYIQRGSTRIDSSPNLCHVDTIDWALIGGPLHKLDYINTNDELCGNCPNKCKGLCWSHLHCQQIPPKNCHPECFDCTKPNAPDKCVACKNYRTNGTCVSQCPNGKLGHPMTVSCLTHHQCYSMQPGNWWPFQGNCVDRCPENYTRVFKDKRFSCEFCEGHCRRACPGIEIDSQTSSKILHGCTHIHGSLAIRLDDEIKTAELYDNLAMIKEIDGYLKIHRSRMITSLNFLKNLKIIHGKFLYNDKHAVVAFENQNLRKLWEHNHTVEVRGGTVYFHDNPELCFSEIEKFAKDSDLEYTEFDVARKSNGDHRKCTTIEFNITVVNVTTTTASFIWENVTATRNMKPPIGYWFCYVENHNGNITYYEDHKDFYEDIWECNLVTDIITYHVSKLRPFTEYAYYLRLLSNSEERDGQTNLRYFTTVADNPSELRSLTATSTTSDSVTLEWKLPEFTNGVLDRYKLVVYSKKDDENLLTERNFCKQPHVPPSNDTVFRSAECCTMEGRLNYLIRKAKRASAPNFTCDTLSMEMTHDPRHGACKNFMFPEDAYRDSGFVPAIPVTAHRLIQRSAFPGNTSSLLEVTLHDPTLTNYTVESLKHFTMFTFVLKVCHRDRPTECSSPVIAYARTLPREGADDIPPGFSANVSGTTVILTWPEPNEPNAMIVAYEFEYKRTDEDNFILVTDCITRVDYVKANHQFQIKNFVPGQYGIRVRAVSLAGPGIFGPYINFEIAEPGFSILSSIALTIGLIGVIIISILCGFYLLLKFRRRPRRHGSDRDILMSTFDIDRDLLPENIQYYSTEHDDGRIFVYNGYFKSNNYAIMYRGITDNGDKNVFLSQVQELETLKPGTTFVLQYFGFVRHNTPPIVVFESPHRNFKAYLEKAGDLPVLAMYKMAAQIADGMAYLHSKNIIHKDLRARNCTIYPDQTVKLGDYGASTAMYEGDYNKRIFHRAVPLRWMSLEWALNPDYPLPAWDVWSYGVLLWEIDNSGVMPYPNMSDSQVLLHIKNGGKPFLKSNCPDIFKKVMKDCWNHTARYRPQFKHIVAELAMSAKEVFWAQSYYLNTPEGKEALREKQNRMEGSGMSRSFKREDSIISNASASSYVDNYSDEDGF